MRIYEFLFNDMGIVNFATTNEKDFFNVVYFIIKNYKDVYSSSYLTARYKDIVRDGYRINYSDYKDMRWTTPENAHEVPNDFNELLEILAEFGMDKKLLFEIKLDVNSVFDEDRASKLYYTFNSLNWETRYEDYEDEFLKEVL